MLTTTSPKLKLLRPNGKDEVYEITESCFKIGRSGENDIRLPDASVSRLHAEIQKQGDEFRLIDKNSKCGTFVNGERISSRTLSHGDHLQMGNDSQLVFLLNDSIPASTAVPASPSISEMSSMFLSVSGNSDLQNVSRLLEMVRMFSTASQLQEVLDLVLDTAIEITAAERAFLILKNEMGEAQFQCGRNRNKQDLGEEYFQISRSVLKNVLEKGEKVFLSDVTEPGAAMSESILNLELRTIVCLPLTSFEIYESASAETSKARIIGAIYLDGKQATEKFTRISQGILDALAADATAVIENTRLLKESHEKERLEMELATAHEIQSSLMRSIQGSFGYFEACAHNIPSRHISGDCYDLIQLPDETYGFVIADVSGKGASAAILCSLVQGLLYAEAMRHPSVAESMNSVNSFMVQRTGGSKFVTLFFGVLLPNGELKYVNAGHNPPMLIHPGGEVEELHSGDPIVGAFDFARYNEKSIQLHAGDIVCLFTDGVTEAHNRDGEMLGEQAFQDLLVENRDRPVKEIVDLTFEKVQEFAKGAPQSDDLSVFVFRYSPSPSSDKT